MTDRPSSAADCTVAGITFLSGSRRGQTVYLASDRIRIGTGPDVDVRIPMDTEPLPAPIHAQLFREGDGYAIQVTPGESVWVDNERIDHVRLSGGETLEVGRDGAVLRFRVYPPGHPMRKSLPDAFSDCYDAAANAEGSKVRRAFTFLTTLQDELDRSLSTRFKAGVLVLIGLLAVSTAFLAYQGNRIQTRLTQELARVEGLQEMLAEANAPPTTEEIARIREQIARDLGDQQARLAAVESRLGSVARVVGEASRATLFIQASYVFTEPETGRPLRFILGPDGEPIRSPLGPPPFTVDGDGPLLEPTLTGTGFIVGTEGSIITNRHVAAPWEVDEVAMAMAARGFRPQLQRFIGYLPGAPVPIALEVAALSTERDLAVLTAKDLPPDFPYLMLDPVPPAIGSEVVVLGYPLGIRALLARSDPAAVEALIGEGTPDFWEVASWLADAGSITPLATRGIVGQVTASAIVYDAETTSGGSGGPVLNPAGRVIAVNMAILPEFGGSNLGVPAAAALDLIRAAAAGADSPAEGRPPS